MSWLWWLQLAADVVLIVAVAGLLMRTRKGEAGQAPSAADLERFIQEAGRLSQEFDRLLSEKRELVRTTLSTLDHRVAELQKTARSLEQPAPAAAPPKPRPAPESGDSMPEFKRQVAALAKQGKDSAQIAEITGRPRGEVELVLGLKKARR